MVMILQMLLRHLWVLLLIAQAIARLQSAVLVLLLLLIGQSRLPISTLVLIQLLLRALHLKELVMLKAEKKAVLVTKTRVSN